MCDISGDNTGDAWPNCAVGHLPNPSDFVRQQLELCQELIKPSSKPDLDNFMAISESFPARVCIACNNFDKICFNFPAYSSERIVVGWNHSRRIAEISYANRLPPPIPLCMNARSLCFSIFWSTSKNSVSNFFILYRDEWIMRFFFLFFLYR